MLGGLIWFDIEYIVVLEDAIGLFKIKWKIGDAVKFGEYQHDTSTKKAPIEWVVLDIKKGTALLISKYCLFTTAYCDFQHLLWEDSVARQLLNNSFFNEAFNKKEKKRIVMRDTILDQKIPVSKDHVFLLTEDEVTTYMPTKESRRALPTKKAVAEGARVDMEPKGYACWWLLPHVDSFVDMKGDFSIYPKAVFQFGGIQYHSRNVYHSDFTIRPAIIVDID